MVQEQKKKKENKRYSKNQSSSRSGYYGNRNEHRSSDLASHPCNWSSSYQPMQRNVSPNNRSPGYMPVDAVLNSDQSSSNESEHEQKTSRNEGRATSSTSHNALNQNKKPNTSSVQSIVQVKPVTSLQKTSDKSTEAIPFLEDVI